MNTHALALDTGTRCSIIARAAIAVVLLAHVEVAPAQSRPDSVAAKTPSIATDSASRKIVRGQVLAHGAPRVGVNIIDIETFDAVTTDPSGRFVLQLSPARLRVAIAVRSVGFRPVDTTLTVADVDTLRFELDAVTELFAIKVLAGSYVSSTERSATLTPLEVATTPGTNADVNSAVKTLPGVQNVDEGSGVFVRGGDYTETKMFVDGAPLFSAYQFDAPTGSIAGTVNPFLLERIEFMSGGFSARYGNALSGIVALRTQGRPVRSYVNANASLANAAVGGGLALKHGIGLAATAGMSDLRPLFALNGSSRDYSPPPTGVVVSANASWGYRESGELKLFALTQRNRMGVQVDDPTYDGTWNSRRNSDVIVASWRDDVGGVRSQAGVSTSGLGRNEKFGSYDMASTLRSVHAHADAQYAFGERVTLLTGAELEVLTSHFDGRIPMNASNRSPGAPTYHAQSRHSSQRDGAYLTLDTRPSSRVQLIGGLRTDNADNATARTVDPRVSVAWLVRDDVTATAAWGRYTQYADPAFFDRAGSISVLPPISDDQLLVGVQVGEGFRSARIEGWTKEYRGLITLDRRYQTITNGTGHAQGIDFFARSTLRGRVQARLTYSGATSKRTDPNTGLQARAAFDVTHSITSVLQRSWSGGWQSGLAYRYATGHPFTDIRGAVLDSVRNTWVPMYDMPNASRLPDLHRVDITVSRAKPLSPSLFFVWYVSVNNVLNRPNAYGVTWSRDYSKRSEIPSILNRSFFVGFNLSRNSK